MDAQEHPHLALQALQKLNPNAVFWRWRGVDRYGGWGPSNGWQRVKKPQWLLYCIYATSDHPKKAPQWTPTNAQLKASERLRKSFEAGKKRISQPETLVISP